MPRLPDVPNVLRLRLQGLINGQPWNVVHYAKYAGPPLSEAQVLAAIPAMGDAWKNSIGTICGSTVQLQRIQVTDLASITGVQVEGQTVWPGTRAGTPLSNQVALVASYAVSARYRGGHPRSYWPAGVGGDITNGRLWATAFLPIADTACTSYVGNINLIALGTGNLTFCAVSFYGGTPPVNGESVLRTTPIVLTVLTVEVHGRVDTMRSRLGKEPT